MFSLTSLLAFAALVVAQAADPSISTPAALVQCQPAQITWTATKTPVFISIIPGGQPSATPLEDLGQQSGTSMTWTVNIAGGTQVTLQIRDGAGSVAYSAPVTIQSSSDSSCIGASASSSGAASSSAAQTGSASVSSASSASASSVAPSSVVASVSSSVAQATSSIVASASSAASSIISSATAPATTSHASSAASTSRAATATSATPSASSTANSARTNMQVSFAGLIGLAAAVVIA